MKRLVALAGLSIVFLTGCGDDVATPIDPANPPTLDELQPSSETGPETAPDLDEVVHFLEPNEQMKEAAAQQCLDDPDLAEGYIKAVDPDDPETIVSEFTVSCDTVRG